MINEGPADTTSIAMEVDEMELNVIPEDMKKFDNILKEYLKKVDPGNKLSSSDAITRLGYEKARSLVRALMNLRYRPGFEKPTI